MKNSKGISMVTLIITIIVMLILSSIVFVVSNDGRERANDAKYYNEKKLLQEAAQTRFASHMRNSNSYPLEGTSLKTSLSDVVLQLETLGCENVDTAEVKDMITDFLDKNQNHAEYNRIISYSDMLALEMTNITYTTSYFYIINYYSLDVIGPIK